MFQMLGVFAEFERSMIKERVRAGLARAKAAGTKLGRPTIPQETEAAIRAALSQPRRPGVRKIAAQFGVDPSTVQRISRPAIWVTYPSHCTMPRQCSSSSHGTSRQFRPASDLR